MRQHGKTPISDVLILGANGGIFQGTGTFAVPTTALKIYNSGGIGIIEMWYDGAKSAYFDTSGRMVIVGTTAPNAFFYFGNPSDTYQAQISGNSGSAASNINLLAGKTTVARLNVQLEIASSGLTLYYETTAVVEIFSIATNGDVKFKTNSTGAGSAALGANCPAVTATAPYTWIRAAAKDGSTVYIPCWK